MVWTLLKTVEFSIPSCSPDALDFRIEVFEDGDPESDIRRYRCRVWRYETFRLMPLSLVAAGEMFDHTCLVLDEMFDGFEVVASSAEDACDACRSKIHSQFVKPE